MITRKKVSFTTQAKRHKIGMKPTAIALAAHVLLLTAAQAQITATSGALVGDKAANGTPIVNIAAPSAAGVSRNTFSAFNTDTKGAILNNRATAGSSVLAGGSISGNPQLGATPAKLILNQVSASTKTTLNGRLEVAGTTADVIVANPMGIDCTACGAINAGRMVLTAGQPILNTSSGALTGFLTRQGLVNINGLSAKESIVDVFAGTVDIDGQVQAKDLNVVVGPASITYGSSRRTITKLADDPALTKHDYRILVKQNANVQAGNIYLLSNDDRVIQNRTAYPDGLNPITVAGVLVGQNQITLVGPSVSAYEPAGAAVGGTSLSTGDFGNVNIVLRDAVKDDGYLYLSGVRTRGLYINSYNPYDAIYLEKVDLLGNLSISIADGEVGISNAKAGGGSIAVQDAAGTLRGKLAVGNDVVFSGGLGIRVSDYSDVGLNVGGNLYLDSVNLIKSNLNVMGDAFIQTYKGARYEKIWKDGKSVDVPTFLSGYVGGSLDLFSTNTFPINNLTVGHDFNLTFTQDAEQKDLSSGFEWENITTGGDFTINAPNTDPSYRRMKNIHVLGDMGILGSSKYQQMFNLNVAGNFTNIRQSRNGDDVGFPYNLGGILSETYPIWMFESYSRGILNSTIGGNLLVDTDMFLQGFWNTAVGGDLTVIARSQNKDAGLINLSRWNVKAKNINLIGLSHQWVDGVIGPGYNNRNLTGKPLSIEAVESINISVGTTSCLGSYEVSGFIGPCFNGGNFKAGKDFNFFSTSDIDFNMFNPEENYGSVGGVAISAGGDVFLQTNSAVKIAGSSIDAGKGITISGASGIEFSPYMLHPVRSYPP